MPRKTDGSGSGRMAAPTGFNEAAARCRGKLRNPAPGRGPVRGFNEAAARCRGKLCFRCFLGYSHGALQ